MKWLLRKQHHMVPRNCNPPSQTNQIGQYFQLCTEILSPQQKFEEARIDCFIDAAKPFMDVENKAFVRMVGAIPGIHLPFNSADTVRRVFSRFEESQTVLYDNLSQTCSYITSSTDCWTSPGNKSFFAIIDHWLTKVFEYKEDVLHFRELHGSHTGELLAATCSTTIEDFGLQDKLLAVTADNASNVVVMVDKLASLVKEHGHRLQFFPEKFNFVRCHAPHSRVSCLDCLRRIAHEARYWKNSMDW